MRGTTCVFVRLHALCDCPERLNNTWGDQNEGRTEEGPFHPPYHIRFHPPFAEPRSLMRRWEQQGSVSSPQRQHIPWAWLIQKSSCPIVEQITSQIPKTRRESASAAATWPRVYGDSFSVCGSWMYWTDWEEDEVNDSIGRIEKAWMDGSNRRIFVTSNMLWPNGLTLDHSTSTMYWCDAYYDHIERIYLNGTGRMVSLSLNLFTWPLLWSWNLINRHKRPNQLFTSINKVWGDDFARISYSTLK